jgi:hypothetical protein
MELDWPGIHKPTELLEASLIYYLRIVAEVRGVDIRLKASLFSGGLESQETIGETQAKLLL